MIKDTDMFVFILPSSKLAKRKVLVPSWETCRSLFAAILNSFVYQIRNNSIRSRAIIVIMDLFMILTQFRYKICIQEKKNLHVITKFNITTNMAANMAALGNISDTEVTFLEISAVIVIQLKNILCELIITCTCTSQIIFHKYHA